MRRILIILLLTLSLTLPVFTPEADALHTVTLTPTEDVTIHSSAPETNHGNYGHLVISRSTYSTIGESKIYLKFNLTELSGIVTVEDATLQLYAYDVKADHTVGAYQTLDSTWTEHELTYITSTYLSPPIAPSDTIVISSSGRWYSWTTTTLVQSAINTADKLLTVVLQVPTTELYSTYSWVNFYSKDYSYPNYRPKLLITYTRQPSSLTLSPPPDKVQWGSTVQLSGNLTPPLDNTEITLDCTRPDQTSVTRKAVTINGAYSDTLTPDQAGVWEIQTSWAGNMEYDGSTSPTQTLSVEPPPTVYGDLQIYVTDQWDKPLGGVEVTSTHQPEEQPPLKDSTPTDGYVTFTHIIAGSYELEASKSEYLNSSVTATVAGDQRAEASIQLTYTSGVSALTLEVIAESLTLGESVKATSQLTPPIGDAAVTLTYMKPDLTPIVSTTRTGADGSYSESFTPSQLGSWSISASWGGNREYEGAVSPTVRFTVTEAPATLTLAAYPPSVEEGEPVVLSGTLKPAISTPITLEVSGDNSSWTTLATVNTTVGGSYTYLWTPTLGGYGVRAHWEEDTSQVVGVSVVEAPVTPPSNGTAALQALEIRFSKQAITIGDTATVTGFTTPPLRAVKVWILNSTDGGNFTKLADVVTSADGSYSYELSPSEVGRYYVKAAWFGGGEEPQVESSVAELRVSKKPSAITVTTHSPRIDKNGVILVSGTLTPRLGGEKITLLYTGAGWGKVNITATTKADGSFTDIYTPHVGGFWNVTASWEGNEEYEAASGQAAFEVVDRGCLIATATYGSEMAGEVQFLRGFREQTVYTTFAGTQFMTAFNAWYYSFSPTVADLISTQPALRGTARVALYPLLGILHLAIWVDTALDPNHEVGVVAAGLVSGALIGIIYLTPTLTLLLSAYRRREGSPPKPGRVKALLMPWTASIILLCLGEAVASPLLTMAATATLILSTVTLSAGATALKLTQLAAKRHM